MALASGALISLTKAAVMVTIWIALLLWYASLFPLPPGTKELLEERNSQRRGNTVQQPCVECILVLIRGRGKVCGVEARTKVSTSLPNDLVIRYLPRWVHRVDSFIG